MKMPVSLSTYIRSIQKSHASGDATEHTYRPAFQTFVESFGKNIDATNEPKRIACGAPDFIVNVAGAPVGYIECKDLGSDLDDAEESDQLKRYFKSLGNLILTDYLEFRYFVNGEPVMRVQAGRVDKSGDVQIIPGAEEQLHSLFQSFFAAPAPTIATPKDLAARMANIAKVIRDAIERAFDIEGEAGTLHNEYESFRHTILTQITPTQFADMYAQTVCYGMFSARVNLPENQVAEFRREHAAYNLPATNPFLREVFDYIAGTKLDSSIVWAVDLLADILRKADMPEILATFGKSIREEDPVVHFYETFLAAYDPKLRETRGVYYTPEPVVGYIVRSIDEILKRDFDCPQGLADASQVTITVPKKGGKAKEQETKTVPRVQILDPATGTGTFLYSTIRHIHDSFAGNKGAWPGYVAKHLLPRLFGFELMMAPYAVAHMKLGWLLKETGYDFTPNERLRVYLTNTLEEAEITADAKLLFANEIAKEANAASNVKTDAPIMVVLGNPPYSGLSANMNEWTDKLLKQRLPLPDGAPSYYECDGKPLGEKKLWLQDDYVKFIRFAQYRIERTGHGVLGFITNHGYLDNPTFRGMRQSLMHTFDDIYILDLHGNAKKKEKSPDGGKDANVFDIMQGVAIGIFVKRPGSKTRKPATVRHAELWGTREEKYEWLDSHRAQGHKWKTLKPNIPHHFFIQRSESGRSEYEKWPPVSEIFSTNVTGIVTARDEFCIDFEKEAIINRIADLRDSKKSESEIRLKYFESKAAGKYLPGDSRGWSLPKARIKVSNDKKWKEHVKYIFYRPFDFRSIYYTPWIVDWPRLDLMPHMDKGRNLGFIYMRQVAAGDNYTHFGVSRYMVDNRAFYSNKGIMSFSPLYLYPNGNTEVRELFTEQFGEGENGRVANISTVFIADYSSKLGLKFLPDGRGDCKKTFGPEDVFHYMYAVFHCPTYRSRYEQFLKVDFPRLPLTSNVKRFAALCELGAELTGLHLLEQVPKPLATFPEKGNCEVEKPRYVPPSKSQAGRVHINAVQYFDGVPPDVWEFHVGGYQVCEKWLKDRKGRTLSYDDIETYRKITESLRQTIRLMAEIDTTIPEWPMQ